ncbi:MAG: transporter [Massilia sp.]|nr:transporter [Massilia sp.]MDB5791634.1 transporter [Massilia sp.]
MIKEPAAPRFARAAVFFGVFLPFALGHYLASLLRNVNAVLAPSLLSTLSLDAADLGLLTSTFFFAFVVAQLPIAAALERYGPYKVQVALLVVAAFGVLLFANGQNFGQLLVARGVIGFGVGGTLMIGVKAVSARVARERLPSLHGYMIAVGGLGAASATLPVRMVLGYTDWRGLFIGLAVLVACIALVTWLVRPRAPLADAGVNTPRPPTALSLLAVWQNRDFRKTITLVLVPHTIFWGMQGFWIGRWLTDVARFPEGAVTYLLYLGMAAVIFGAIGVGIVTEWAGRRGIVPHDVAAIGVSAFMLVQFAFVLNYAPSFQMLAVLFTLVGTIAGIEYSIVAQSVPRELAGHASSCLNMLIFLGAFLVQAGFGLVLSLWEPDFLGRYPAVAYQAGFGVLVLLQLPGLLSYLRQRRPAICAVDMLALEEDEFEVSTLGSAR